jgi:L-threonylcarbamoyladenylate synthase
MQTLLRSVDEPGWLADAVEFLRRHQPIVIPTDTVYGLAALAADHIAVERIFTVKERPPDRPLPVFPASLERTEEVVELGDRGRRLVETFWPGALTVVARRRMTFNSRGLLGQNTVGVRLPDSAPVLELLAAAGEPLAVTSANRSGAGSVATAPEAVAALDGLVPLVIDGGVLAGQESSVIDITRGLAVLLRDGAIDADRLSRALGEPVARE